MRPERPDDLIIQQPDGPAQQLVLLFHGITAADLPEVLFGFGMCCIGALGLFTVARVAGSDGRPAIPRHAVG